MSSRSKPEIRYWPRGDSVAIVHDRIKDVSGVLVTDFTGWKFHATLKANEDDADVAALITMDTVDFTLIPASSMAYGFMDTSTMAVDTRYYFDAQIVDGGGNVATAIKKIFIFEQDITQRTT